MMKYFTRLLMMLTTAFVFSSCTKDTGVTSTPLASLNVINAVVGGTTAKFGSRATAIASNNYTPFSLSTGNNPIYIFPSADSLNPYVNTSLTVSEGDIYSLFIAGTPDTIDTVWINEGGSAGHGGGIPYHTDSAMGVRFINLSPDSGPLNITLSGTPATNEAGNLSYKQYTDFTSYPTLYNTTYTFQVRAAADTSVVLTSYSFTATTLPRFANVTLVIRGLEGGTPAMGVTLVKNDR